MTAGAVVDGFVGQHHFFHLMIGLDGAFHEAVAQGVRVTVFSGTRRKNQDFLTQFVSFDS
jgi:hypothetical protein